MTDLTAEKVYELARQMAANYPDARYEPPEGVEGDLCFYTLGTLAGREGCMFGQVLTDLGVPKEVLEQADAEPDGMPIAALLENVLGVTFADEELPRELQRAQRWQDQQQPLRRVFND